ncbi:MAG: MFS transporter [Nitrospinae bacterium CG11_big_fil_rev_8_21_14_0_20_56_8]|nr:MAG: MFS transporter [Nitrospinae bacterium CG11_big_fil_rev_8_21_14_0_20_56_8]
MVTTLINFGALLLGIALIMLGNGLQGTLLALRASLEGFSTLVIGLVMSGYYVGFLLGSSIAPRIVQRVGHIRVFAALASVASAAVLLHILVISPAWWILFRLVTGFCFSGLYVVTESWLNHGTTNEYRGRTFAIYMMIQLGGVGGGQLLLNAGQPGGFTLFLLVSILVSIAVVPILVTVSPVPDFSAPTHVSIRRLYEISPLAFWGGIGAGILSGGFWSLGPIFAEKVGLSLAQISYFMVIVTLGGMVGQWPIGRLSDRHDRRKVIALDTFLAAGVALAAALVSTHLPGGLYVLAFGFGVFSFPLYSLIVAHTNDHLQPSEMVAASGSLIIIVGVGASLGPFLAGAMITVMGAPGFFIMLALFHAAIGGYGLYYMNSRERTPLEEQVSFVSVSPRMSPVAATIAPQIVQENLSTAPPIKKEHEIPDGSGKIPSQGL